MKSKINQNMCLLPDSAWRIRIIGTRRIFRIIIYKLQLLLEKEIKIEFGMCSWRKKYTKLNPFHQRSFNGALSISYFAPRSSFLSARAQISSQGGLSFPDFFPKRAHIPQLFLRETSSSPHWKQRRSASNNTTQEVQY